MLLDFDLMVLSHRDPQPSSCSQSSQHEQACMDLWWTQLGTNRNYFNYLRSSCGWKAWALKKDGSGGESLSCHGFWQEDTESNYPCTGGWRTSAISSAKEGGWMVAIFSFLLLFLWALLAVPSNIPSSYLLIPCLLPNLQQSFSMECILFIFLEWPRDLGSSLVKSLRLLR